jgi:hypothetical protein
MTRSFSDIAREQLLQPQEQEGETRQVQPARGLTDVARELYGIGQTRTPAGNRPENRPWWADAGLGLAGSAAQATGTSVEGLERFVRTAAGDPTIQGREGSRFDPATWAGPATGEQPELFVAPVAGFLEDAGQGLLDQRSLAALQAIEGSRVSGNLLRGEIDFGDNPSLRGYTQQFFEGLGSLAPVIVATVATRTPATGAVTGGAQGAEASRDEAMQRVDRIVSELTPTQLAQIPTYAQSLEAGMSEEEALENLRMEAGDAAFCLHPSCVCAWFSYATGAILRNVPGRGIARSIALGSVEEGAQEVAEGLASEAGTASTGLPVTYGEDSAANFVMGALVGGGVGLAGGYAGRNNTGPGEEITSEDLTPDVVDPTGDAPTEMWLMHPLLKRR